MIAATADTSLACSDNALGTASATTVGASRVLIQPAALGGGERVAGS